MYIYYLLLDYHPPTTTNYTLSLHDALPISPRYSGIAVCGWIGPSSLILAATQILRICWNASAWYPRKFPRLSRRSEEHTSELQSHVNLVCRLLLEKKNHVYYILFFIID